MVAGNVIKRVVKAAPHLGSFLTKDSSQEIAATVANAVFLQFSDGLNTPRGVDAQPRGWPAAPAHGHAPLRPSARPYFGARDTPTSSEAVHRAKDINKRLARAQTLKQIVDTLEVDMASPYFNSVNITTALHRLAKMAHDSDLAGRLSPLLAAQVGRMVTQLNNAAMARLPEIDAQGLANVLWANATIKRVVGNEAMLSIAHSAEVAAGIADGDAPSPSTRTLPSAEDPATTRPAASMDAMDMEEHPHVHAYVPDEVCRPHRPGSHLWGAVLAEVDRKLGSFQPQGIANIMWAFSTLDYHPPRSVVARLLHAAAPILPRFEPQHLSITVYACALLAYDPGQGFLAAVARAAASRVADFKPQELSNLLWGMARLGHANPALLDAAAALCAARPEYFARPQHSSSVMWALASLGHSGALHAGRQLAAVLARHAHEARPAEVITGAWAATVLEHAAAAASQRLVTPGPGSLALVAAAGQVASRVATSGQLGMLRSEEVVHAAWSLAMVGSLEPGLWEACAEALQGAAGGPRRASGAELRQLMEAALLMEQRLPGSLNHLRPNLLAPCLSAWSAAEEANAAATARVLSQVEAALVAAGSATFSRSETSTMGMLQIHLGNADAMIAIEVVPLASHGTAPPTHSLARLEILRRAGWATAAVNAADMAAAGAAGGACAQMDLLARALGSVSQSRRAADPVAALQGSLAAMSLVAGPTGALGSADAAPAAARWPVVHANAARDGRRSPPPGFGARASFGSLTAAAQPSEWAASLWAPQSPWALAWARAGRQSLDRSDSCARSTGAESPRGAIDTAEEIACRVAGQVLGL